MLCKNVYIQFIYVETSHNFFSVYFGYFFHACFFHSLINKTPVLFLMCSINLMNKSYFVVVGTGCLVTAVQTAAGRDPIIVGKPSKQLVECIKTR